MFPTNKKGRGNIFQKKRFTLAEIERQITYDITYMWNLKEDRNKSYLANRNKITNIENRSVVAKGEGSGGGWMDWEFGISRFKLL